MNMNLLRMLPPRSWLWAATAIVAGLISGACSAGLRAFINRSLNIPGRSEELLAVGFAGLLVGKILANAAARLLLNHFTQETISELCRKLSRRVLATHLAQLDVSRGSRSELYLDAINQANLIVYQQYQARSCRGRVVLFGAEGRKVDSREKTAALRGASSSMIPWRFMRCPEITLVSC